MRQESGSAILIPRRLILLPSPPARHPPPPPTASDETALAVPRPTEKHVADQRENEKHPEHPHEGPLAKLREVAGTHQDRVREHAQRCEGRLPRPADTPEEPNPGGDQSHRRDPLPQEVETNAKRFRLELGHLSGGQEEAPIEGATQETVIAGRSPSC